MCARVMFTHRAMSTPFQFYDQSALIYRLSGALREAKQEVVFLVGSPLSAPLADGKAGVPNVAGIIQLIRETFISDQAQLKLFEQAVSSAYENSYQSAFHFLQGRRGQAKANEIILSAVLADRNPKFEGPHPSPSDEDACDLLEVSADCWSISPGTEH